MKKKTTLQLKVGELAERAGVSVRTLHHYDEIGLLRPKHSSAGHRLYGESDVERLLQIKALRQLGFSLEEVAQTLKKEGFSLREALMLRLARLQDEVAARQTLLRRLQAVVNHIDREEALTVDTLFQTMEAMMRVESYFTPEQLKELEANRQVLGEAGVARVHAEWRALLAEVEAEMAKGTDPSSPRARELAARWVHLAEAFTGGNPQIAASMRNLLEHEPTIQGFDVAKLRAAGRFIVQACESDKA